VQAWSRDTSYRLFGYKGIIMFVMFYWFHYEHLIEFRWYKVKLCGFFFYLLYRGFGELRFMCSQGFFLFYCYCSLISLIDSVQGICFSIWIIAGLLVLVFCISVFQQFISCLNYLFLIILIAIGQVLSNC